MGNEDKERDLEMRLGEGKSCICHGERDLEKNKKDRSEKKVAEEESCTSRVVSRNVSVRRGVPCKLQNPKSLLINSERVIKNYYPGDTLPLAPGVGASKLIIGHSEHSEPRADEHTMMILYSV
ncbi:hypothetical protein FNV43_RR26717 [Rhamnella rubrinervis]|uniref:Uncharacterized protein n=1 Tax=Rhamnella rubrinervis TaxID=2594499 RepID=A0A8K0GP12_9ROSA|nr:hypothetical protein FNV43_RR26717 [Rhamnella rubrinervis]